MPMPAKFSSSQRITIAREYEAGATASELATKYDSCVVTILEAVRAGGGVVRPPSTHDGPIKVPYGKICEVYQQTKSAIKTARLLGIVKKTVFNALATEGVLTFPSIGRRRTYTLNESVFDTVTPESAYWIGFLMADGCVLDPKGVPSIITISVHERDWCHIESFRAFLESNLPILWRPAATRSYKGGPSVMYSVRSRRLASALAVFGVKPRKSYTAKVIGLENSRDYWRGMIDGDGSMHASGRNGSPTINLTGSIDTITQFCAFTRTVAPWCRNNPCKSKGVFQTSTSGIIAVAVIRALYENCTVALPRKLAVAKSLMQWQPKFIRYQRPQSEPQPTVGFLY